MALYERSRVTVGFPLSRNFYLRMHVNFTRLHEIETMNGRSRVNEKLNLAQLLHLRVTSHTLPFILFALVNFKHVRGSKLLDSANPS